MYEIIKKIERLESEITEFQQPRSDFALRHFVVGQHDLPGRQRLQAIMELQVKMFAMKRSLIEREKLTLEIERWKRKLTDNDDLMARRAELGIKEKELDLAELDLALLGAAREAETLYRILSTMPKYTREQVEAEESEYWMRRLTRQYVIGQRDLGGNLDAVLQTLTEPGKAKPLGWDAREEVLGAIGMDTGRSQLTE